MKAKYLFFVLFFYTFVGYSNVIFVSAAASGLNDGSSWANAYVNLQDAIFNATTNDTIWVSQGTYYPDQGVGYTNNNRSHSFVLKNNLTILGGFNGSETTVAQRNWALNTCILSGDIDQSNDSLNNTYTVVVCQSINNTSVLDGFSIKDGNNYTNYKTGGIYCNAATPILKNLIVSNNYSSGSSGSSLAESGGGIYLTGGSNARIENVVIRNNNSKTNCSWTSTSLSSRASGGIWIRSSSPRLINVVVENNFANAINTGTGNGGFQGALVAGGILISEGGSSPIILNSVIRNNRGECNSEYSFSGGGISSSYPATPNISNVIIEGNYAKSTAINAGSGAYSYSGGGIFVEYNNGRIISNATIYNNTAEAIAPGTDKGEAGAYLAGSTFAGYIPVISNSIIFNNKITTPSLGNIDFRKISAGNSDPTFNNCLFTSYTGGTNCIVGNPLFRDTLDLNGPDDVWFTSDDGLHISCGSAAMNNGDSTLLFLDVFDLDGDNNLTEVTSYDFRGADRVRLTNVDIGAFEFQGLSTTSGTGVANISGACGYTWIDGNTYSSNNNTATYTYPGLPDECDSTVTLNLTINPISDQLITVLNPTLCSINSGTDITIGSSDAGVSYVLRDNSNNSVVDGPIIGTGSSLTFSTGTLSANKTYNIYGIKENLGHAVNLPASNDYINFSTPFTAFSNEITIEAWVDFSSGAHPWAGQGTQSLDNMTSNVWLWHSGTFYVNDNGTWRALSFPSIPSTGWGHIATVANSSGLFIYYNGVLVASNSAGITSVIRYNPSSVIALGHDVRFAAGTPGRNSQNAFDDFRVWNVARNASEILSNMNVCLIGNEPNLMQLTNFEEGTGSIINSDKGSDATIVNAGTNWVTGSGVCGYSCSLQMSSIHTVNVLAEKLSAESSTICAEESLTINGTVYNAANPSGTEVFTNVGPYGCDSTVTINLTILPVLASSITNTICAEESITVNGTIYNAVNPNGTEVFTNIGPYGCDSTVTVNLTVLPALASSITSTICAEESITVNGTVYNATNPNGIEVFTNIGSNGCDSTVTINLTVLPALTGTVSSTLCSYDSIVVNGVTYNQSNPTGIEVFTNVGANGCDSIVTINLSFTTIDVSVANQSVSLLANEVSASFYQWLDCDDNNIVSGEVNQLFSPLVNGSYAVIITKDGCVDSSQCELISSIGIIENVFASKFNVFPNPTNGNFSLQFESIQESLELKLITITGETILTKNVKNTNKIELEIIEAAGMYFLEIVNQNKEKAILKIVKE